MIDDAVSIGLHSVVRLKPGKLVNGTISMHVAWRNGTIQANV